MDNLGSIGLSWTGRRSAGFNPLTLNPTLWLKADTGLWQDSGKTVAVATGGDPIGAWADQSGNVRDVLQATAAKRPTWQTGIQNGNAIVRFDGVDDFLQSAAFASFTLPGTVVFVASFRSTGTGYTIFDGDTNASCAVRLTGAGPFVWTLQAGAGTGTYGTANTNWHTFKAVFNTVSSAFNIDNVDQTPTSNPGGSSLTKYTLGAMGGAAAGFGPVDVGELYFFPGTLAAQDWTNLFNYLRSKWGTP